MRWMSYPGRVVQLCVRGGVIKVTLDCPHCRRGRLPFEMAFEVWSAGVMDVILLFVGDGQSLPASTLTAPPQHRCALARLTGIAKIAKEVERRARCAFRWSRRPCCYRAPALKFQPSHAGSHAGSSRLPRCASAAAAVHNRIFSCGSLFRVSFFDDYSSARVKGNSRAAHSDDELPLRSPCHFRKELWSHSFGSMSRLRVYLQRRARLRTDQGRWPSEAKMTGRCCATLIGALARCKGFQPIVATFYC